MIINNWRMWNKNKEETENIINVIKKLNNEKTCKLIKGCGKNKKTHAHTRKTLKAKNEMFMRLSLACLLQGIECLLTDLFLSIQDSHDV